MNDLSSRRVGLRDLPLAARLVLTVFLASVGFGYFSALVQLHFKHADSGNMLPGKAETIEVYHGQDNISQLERVLTSDESKPFNGGGSMKAAFFSRSSGWYPKIKKLKKGPNPQQAIEHLRAERDGERLALIDWVHNGSTREGYETDSYPLPLALLGHPITKDYLATNEDGTEITPPRVKIKSIFNDRCVRCHGEDKGGTPSKFPLETCDQVHVYCQKESSGAISLTQLAQTTHVHLLGFAMLFGLTGLAFSFTSYPAWVRCLFGPWTLVAQVVDISCWWLGRTDERLAQVIIVTGSLVALGLLVQILGSLLNLFGKVGQAVIIILLLAVGAGGYLAKKEVIDPYLVREKNSPEIRDINIKP